MDYAGPLWAQFGYALWQFVRVAKLFRIPYGFLNSLVACIFFFFKNKLMMILPFQKISYMTVSNSSPQSPYFVDTEFFMIFGTPVHRDEEMENGTFEFSDYPCGLPTIWKDPKTQHMYERSLELRMCKLRLNGEDFSFLLKGKKNFLLNICRDKPKLFGSVSDMIIPGCSILEPIKQEDALNKLICEGCNPSIGIDGRVIPIWLVEDELNRNFIRILATLPLVAQAKGEKELLRYFFFAVLAIDMLGVLFEKVHHGIRRFLLHLFKKFVSQVITSPRVRFSVSEFSKTLDTGLKFCDRYCHNFVPIEKGGEYLVCNTRACQLGGEMGEPFQHHNPNGDEVTNSDFTECELTLQSGEPMTFSSDEGDLYKIEKCKLFIYKATNGRGGRDLEVFCDDISLHSGSIDAECIFYMLNAMKLVARKGHLPVQRVIGNTAHSVAINDFISNPLFFLSIQTFKASKNMWIG